MEPSDSRLLEIAEQPERSRPAAPETGRRPKLKRIDREQGLLRPVIVEELVGPEHKVRAIWDLTGELDLSAFYGKIRSREGEAGSSAWDPRLLLSIWLYSYSEQVGSAREIARRCCPPGKPSRLISIRLGENPLVTAFRAKMETPEAKLVYKRRGPAAEFPNCWIKEKLGLRKFRLRGLAKATLEAIWAVLTYDVLQWARWNKTHRPAAAMAA